MFRNVGKELPLYVGEYPRRAQTPSRLRQLQFVLNPKCFLTEPRTELLHVPRTHSTCTMGRQKRTASSKSLPIHQLLSALPRPTLFSTAGGKKHSHITHKLTNPFQISFHCQTEAHERIFKWKLNNLWCNLHNALNRPANSNKMPDCQWRDGQVPQTCSLRKEFQWSSFKFYLPAEYQTRVLLDT